MLHALLVTLLLSFTAALAQKQPEATLLLGDTNRCLSVIQAKRPKVPIFQMVAGDRCIDKGVSEETNRRIVDHTSDINLAYSCICCDYLLREGLASDQFIKSASPIYGLVSQRFSRS